MNKSYWKALELQRDGMFVPPALINEMVDTADIKEDSKVAVLFSFEMLAILQERGHKDVVLISDSPKKYVRNICAKYGYEVKTFDDSENMKFDVIIGNPPFQKQSKEKDRVGSRGNTSIWDQFVVWSLDHLHDGGTMAMVHPTSWRKPNDRYGFWKLLTQDNQMVALTMRSGRREQNLFKIGVRFDYYVLEKTPKYKNTIVKDHEDKVYNLDLAKWDWLPNFAINEIKPLLGRGCTVLYNTKYHTQKGCTEKKTKANQHPVVHTINKNGLGVKYFKDLHLDGVHFEKKKVLLNQNEVQYPVYDSGGEYGMSQLSFAIQVKNAKQGKKLVEYLNSEQGRRIIAATKWNTFYTDYNMFCYFSENFYE